MTDRPSWIRQQKVPRARQALLRLFRTRAPRTHLIMCPNEWARQVQGQVRRGVGQAARGDVRAAEEARRHSRRTPSSPRGTARSRRWTTCRRALKPVLGPADGGVCRRSWSTPTTMWAGCSIRWSDPRVFDDTLVFYIIGDNGALRRRHAERHLQRDDLNLTAPSHGDAGVHLGAYRRSRRPRVPTTTMPSAGRTRWTRPISGPSRSRRIGADAQRHDRPLADGDQGEGRDPEPVPSRHRHRADDPRGGGTAGTGLRQRRPAAADGRRRA